MQPKHSYKTPEWLEYHVEQALPENGEQVTWVPGDSFEESALVRVPRFPSNIPDGEQRDLELDVLPNGTRSAQLAVASSEEITDLRVDVSEFTTDDGRELPSSAIRSRFVGYVPVERSLAEYQGHTNVTQFSSKGISGTGNPDLIADPLLETDTVDVPPYQAQPVWFTISPDVAIEPGSYGGEITLVGNQSDLQTDTLTLDVRNVPLPDPVDYDFHLDVWLNPDVVAVEHGSERWSDEHWRLLARYFEDLADAGQSMITVPIVHEPWQREWKRGDWRPQTEVGYSSLIKWRFDDEWTFEYERFDRFVETALEYGVGPEISAYSPLAFKSPQRLTYFDQESESMTVERVEAGSDRWQDVWTAFLADFKRHLDRKDWLDKTYLGFDERPPELMESAVELVESVAPEFSDRIQIAGSVDVESFADDLSVIHQHLSLDQELLESRRSAEKRTTFYVCVSPDHPNTFTVSPLQESRMLPWIAANEGLDGFLRWAYNSWPREPFENPVFRFTQGDEYLVYPGTNGPLSSVRWEQLKEGIEEYELVAKLRRKDSDNEPIAQALALAARDEDAREKELSDFTTARQQIVEELERVGDE